MQIANDAADTSPATHLNVDLQEVSKFEVLASRWWDPESEFKPLHQINPLRTNFIDVEAGIFGKKIIDVGCGGGILSEAMAQRGGNVTGIDMGEAPLNVARLHLLESNLKVDYQRMTAEEAAQKTTPDTRYDIVTCLEMLEHVPDPSSVIKACADMVQPNGDVFFSTINRNPKAYMLAVIGAEYILKMLPRGTHDYRKFIKPSELGKWCRDAGLEIKKITGMTYNPLTKVYKLDRDVDVNYLVHCKKIEHATQ